MHKPRFSVQNVSEVIDLNRLIKRGICIFLCLMVVFSCSACMNSGNETADASIPEIPSRLSTTDDGTPILKVYNTASESSEKMDIETYLMGVVAGEMKNTWPIEALKAQAILARTFTMKFVTDKKSGYDDADISTDVTEAQAYNADDINDRIREAVNETRGMVMVADGEFPYAWFHAHSGGKTELPSKALEYKEDPAYLSSVRSAEPDDAPDSVKNWTAEFTLDQVRKACKEAGVEVDKIESFEIGEVGESGRAVNFLVNGQKVSAPAFRLGIDASKLKSTLIETIELQDGKLVISGRGFGHGVGMSQWGARKMADEGKSAEQIIGHYFTGIELIELW